jgi:fatty aldehyde decarbonylase
MTPKISTLLKTNFESEAYKSAYRKIIGIAIAGERQAVANYLSLQSLMPLEGGTLLIFSRMERAHADAFAECAKDLDVDPDTEFGEKILASIHANFQTALNNEDLVSSLLIQSILIESFSLSAYKVYVKVAHLSAQTRTSRVIADEAIHLNFSQNWMRSRRAEIRREFFQSNRENLPLIHHMLNQFSDDARAIGLKKIHLIISFIREYQKALTEIGYNFIDRLILTVPLFF